MFDLEKIFSELIEGMMEEAVTEALKEAEKNNRLPSVDSLVFTPLPAERGRELMNKKTGLFTGGARKKLAASIEEGRTAFSEVLVLARLRRLVDRSENRRFNTWKYYYKVADLNGNVIREDLPLMDDEFAFSFELNNGSSASDTGCPDRVPPRGYPHMFVLHYYLKDDQYYVLLTGEQLEDLSVLVKYAGSRFHCPEDGVGYKW